MSAPAPVILVEILELTAPYEEVAPLIAATMARLEREGVRGLASMHFYTDLAHQQLAAVIAFSDPADMQAHTNMIGGWPEFQRFAQHIKLKEMRIHGVVGPEVRAWIAQFPGAITTYDSFVAGFRR